MDVNFAKYFHGMKMLGDKDLEFLDRINPTFVFVVVTGIGNVSAHVIRARTSKLWILQKAMEM